MSVGQVVGGLATLGIVGGLLNEVMGDDKPKQPQPQDKPDAPRSTSFCKTVGVGLGLAAGVSLMGAFNDALQKPFTAPALTSIAPQTQLAAGVSGPGLTPPNLNNPFANGPTFTPGIMG